MFGMTQPNEKDPVTGEVIQPAGQVPNTVSTAPSPGGTAIGDVPLSDNSAGLAGGAVTYPIEGPGSKPGPGLQMGPVEQGEPYQPPFDPTPDRGPAGQKPRKMAEDDPTGLYTITEQASSVARSTRMNADDNQEQLAQMNKATGVTRKTIKELEDEIRVGLKRAVEDKKITEDKAKELRTGWRRIFNQIHEDEMGLFLMDFGLRAMMAGESMGTVGALGAAGSGALQALQGRRRQAVEDEMSREQMVQKGALDKYTAESGRISAEAQAKRAELAGQGYRGEKAWLLELGKATGRSDEEMMKMFEGGASETERRQYWMEWIADVVAKAKTDANLVADMNPKDSSGKYYKEYTEDDMFAFDDRMVAGEFGAGGSTEDDEGGALPSNTDKTADEYYDETG
jgi:hypothetical protein